MFIFYDSIHNSIFIINRCVLKASKGKQTKKLLRLFVFINFKRSTILLIHGLNRKSKQKYFSKHIIGNRRKEGLFKSKGKKNHSIILISGLTKIFTMNYRNIYIYFQKNHQNIYVLFCRSTGKSEEQKKSTQLRIEVANKHKNEFLDVYLSPLTENMKFFKKKKHYANYKISLNRFH